jgi:hypothetical protein
MGVLPCIKVKLGHHIVAAGENCGYSQPHSKPRLEIDTTPSPVVTVGEVNYQESRAADFG